VPSSAASTIPPRPRRCRRPASRNTQHQRRYRRAGCRRAHGCPTRPSRERVVRSAVLCFGRGVSNGRRRNVWPLWRTRGAARARRARADTIPGLLCERARACVDSRGYGVCGMETYSTWGASRRVWTGQPCGTRMRGMRSASRQGVFIVRFFKCLCYLCAHRSFVRSSEGCNTNNTKQTTRDDEERCQYRPNPIRKAAYFLSFIRGPKCERMYRSQRQPAGPS